MDTVNALRASIRRPVEPAKVKTPFPAICCLHITWTTSNRGLPLTQNHSHSTNPTNHALQEPAISPTPTLGMIPSPALCHSPSIASLRGHRPKSA
ncbi:hypothetical protein BDV33DRAFT_171950 [Aspergillus novoparasiticus]|uniref:Uncharacterized protein n=1 Tax=Aspergillus novoparasiticus TaxID=986946 RepID=A0A5N6ET56_9EURO|nr:hypothetical protein BDV33DRAFT_171950 [Aspergillus novoparasiticus]